MPTSEFFTQHGLFAVENFLDRELCAQIRREIGAEAARGIAKQHKVWKPDANAHVDGEVISRIEFVKTSLDSYAPIRRRLIELMPQLAKHFSVELTDCQNIKFTLYKAGDYFKPHVDGVGYESAPQELKDRKVSVVIFINDESAEPAEDGYVGGNLTFYGLMPDSPFGNFGLPLTGEAGLLIAFPPHLLHEVTPVTGGERFVLVTWYI